MLKHLRHLHWIYWHYQMKCRKVTDTKECQCLGVLQGNFFGGYSRATGLWYNKNQRMEKYWQGVSDPVISSPEFYLQHPGSAFCEHLSAAGAASDRLWTLASNFSVFYSRLKEGLGLCQQWRCWTHTNRIEYLWLEVVFCLPFSLFFGVKLFVCNNSWLSLICTFPIMIFVDLPWFEFGFHCYYGF